MNTSTDRPWLRYYGGVPSTIAYPRITLYEAVAATAQRQPSAVAWDFKGTTATYGELLASIDACANALAALGLAAGDRLLISMPTAPSGVIAVYAANKLGVVSALIHPLSTEREVEQYLNESGAQVALTLDAFFGVFARVEPTQPLRHIVLARIGDHLSPVKRFGFWLTKGRKIAPVVPPENRITGVPKGVVLSSRNVIAAGMQAAAWVGMRPGDSILAILPIFHGFGLGVCVNAAFLAGATSILVPQFSAEIVAKLLKSARPSLLVGVPTLYDALSKDPSLAKSDLSCLRACFSGADTLPRQVKERFEALVAAHSSAASPRSRRRTA